ncbi:rod shape-determining protein MreC [bacterium]|nr:rod shape-determining protein MreC [bacterium]
MFRLIRFLTSNRNLLFFLFLEGLAMWMVISFNDHQQHIFGDEVLEATSRVHTRRAKVASYFHLRQENEQLIKSFETLQKRAQNLEAEVLALQELANVDSTCWEWVDSLKSKESYDYISCQAIKNTIDRNYNYITLDKGSKQGVKIGMGLVSPQGIAGRVIKTSENFSIALSAINVSFKLSVKVDGTDNVGSYEWLGPDPALGDLRYIPIDIPLVDSQKVVTSGYSTIFPEGFTVGYISDLRKNNQVGFYEAKVALATNFRALGNLYLVEATHKPAIDSLEAKLSQ